MLSLEKRLAEKYKETPPNCNNPQYLIPEGFDYFKVDLIFSSMSQTCLSFSSSEWLVKVLRCDRRLDRKGFVGLVASGLRAGWSSDGRTFNVRGQFGKGMGMIFIMGPSPSVPPQHYMT